LISGGAGTAPAWGKISLTSHVSGVLAVTNGGTGASSISGLRTAIGAAASGANSDITSLSALSTPLSAAQGGSGQSSYTVGDLLYANSATSLSRLADVPAGNALISGGAGVAPTWGKVSLTNHVSGILPVANGGTGASSISGLRTAIGAAASGANSDITSLSALSTPLSTAQGGTGSGTPPVARANLGAAASGANSDITSLNGLTTALPIAEGGTGSTTGPGARANIGAAASGANVDITSLGGLTSPLGPTQGGSGQ